jgi:hypothetical protein
MPNNKNTMSMRGCQGGSGLSVAGKMGFGAGWKPFEAQDKQGKPFDSLRDPQGKPALRKPTADPSAFQPQHA